MTSNYKAVLLLTVLCMTGCTATTRQEPTPENAGVHSLRFQPVFETFGGALIKNSNLPKGRIFAFRLKPGSLLGGSLYGTVDLQRVSSTRDKLALDLDSWMPFAWDKALPVSGTRIRDGISIEPGDTRLAQVLPLVYSEGSGPLGGRFVGSHSYFMDEGEQDADLMYFDRACHLKGAYQQAVGKRTVTVDIEIPGPGFYLLSYVTGLGRDNYWLVLSPFASTINLVTKL
ncbi:MAG TPA: hypothetical protein VGN07_14850 [Steroidobacteraceae bacterium]|jgi:hypothetical protein